MSNQRIVNNIRTRGNGRAPTLDWEGAGFAKVDWNKHTYTWQGDGFPVFVVRPGLIPHPLGLASGIIAECGAAEVRLYFEYGTQPEEIKAQLDDAILEIMRHDADCPPVDWDEWEAEGLAIDFDDYMNGEWVRS